MKVLLRGTCVLTVMERRWLGAACRTPGSQWTARSMTHKNPEQQQKEHNIGLNVCSSRGHRDPPKKGKVMWPKNLQGGVGLEEIGDCGWASGRGRAFQAKGETGSELPMVGSPV